MPGNLPTLPSKRKTGLSLLSIMLVGGGFVPRRTNCATLGVDCKETANEKTKAWSNFFKTFDPL
jgi:hypothetical protein